MKTFFFLICRHTQIIYLYETQNEPRQFFILFEFLTANVKCKIFHSTSRIFMSHTRTYISNLYSTNSNDPHPMSAKSMFQVFKMKKFWQKSDESKAIKILENLIFNPWNYNRFQGVTEIINHFYCIVQYKMNLNQFLRV